MCTDEESQLKVPASKGLPKLTHRVAGACNKLTQTANDITTRGQPLNDLAQGPRKPVSLSVGIKVASCKEDSACQCKYQTCSCSRHLRSDLLGVGAPLLRTGLATDFESGKSSAFEKRIRSILNHDFVTVRVNEFQVAQGTRTTPTWLALCL